MKSRIEKIGPKIITIDGLDGSGKETSSKALLEKLISLGYVAEMISFPMYDRWHSFLVRWYLKGRFGKNPAKVNPYLCCIFYALDRFFAYWTVMRKDWEYKDFIILDRYTTSNMIFQAMKCNAKHEHPTVSGATNKILNYIEKLEYGFFRLPRPDKVLIMDISVSRVLNNLKNRGQKLDIHETREVQLEAYTVLQYLIYKYKWSAIDVMTNDKDMKSTSEIVDLILKELDIK